VARTDAAQIQALDSAQARKRVADYCCAFRRLKRLGGRWIGAVAAVALAVIFWVVLDPRHNRAVLLLWFASLFLVNLYVAAWPCPKCGRPFRSMLLSLVTLWPGKKCANCGVPFGEK
jgi:hypothetical protein